MKDGYTSGSQAQRIDGRVQESHDCCKIVRASAAHSRATALMIDGPYAHCRKGYVRAKRCGEKEGNRFGERMGGCVEVKEVACLMR